MTLDELGWKIYLKTMEAPAGDLDVGRVAVENRTNYLLYTKLGEINGTVRGKFLNDQKNSGMPKVGDWVVYAKSGGSQAAIESVLPRKTKISRPQADDDRLEQVMIANVDVLFIVQGLDNDFNLRKLERYLVVARESGARPVIILNKSDLQTKDDGRVAQAKKLSPDVSVLAVSAQTGEGLDEVRKLLGPGITVAFIGSSGVGKSTIINALLGSSLQKTAAVRGEDSKGRHTTTKRELIILPQGGLLIDTPGMREIGIWGADVSVEKAFLDIKEIIKRCKFGNCDHIKSKGCALVAAVADGVIAKERYDNFIKLQKEVAFLESNENKYAHLDRKRKDKVQNKGLRRRLKEKYDSA